MAGENDVLTRDNDGNLAVRTVSSTGDNYVNPDDVYTRDSEGKLCVRTTGEGGGGGSVDYNRVIEKSATIPSATSSNVGKVYMYTGETNAIYTHGYIYENQSVSEYEDTVTFVPATISGTVVSATSNSLASLVAEYITGDITSIVSGTMTYESDGNLWVFVGKDSENTTVGTFQIYQEDYEDAGFTFTGTPENGDVVAFTCTITESTSYAWVRIDVQPAGGSDSHNLGWYADLTALQTAHPTGSNGDFAILGSTDTVWVWDSGTSAWVDTDTKGQVTSVNGQTGAVTVQETLVNQTNIKSVDGNSLLGSGNLELSTYLTYPAGWTTNSTTKAFCDDIATDTTATKGKAYLGEVTCSDLPASMLNAEVVVEIMDGTTAQDKVIVLSLKSGNVAPYAWQYVYWDNGTNVSGWKTWQETLVSGTNIKTINGTTLLGSGDIETEVIQVSTMPTASATEEGNIYQYVGTTDANYTNGYFYKCVSDGQEPATYSWTAIQVQASSGGLPSQTGNAGKFLTTDGTDASWSDKPLVNYATANQSNSLLIGTATSAQSSGSSMLALGYSVTISNCGTAIGRNTIAGNDSVAIGYGAKASPTTGIAVGRDAVCGNYASFAMQFGGGTNNDSNTVKFKNANGNFEIMSADGTIPHARLTNAVSSTSVTIATTDWSSNTASVTVSGLTATSVVWVAPDNASQSAYLDAGVYASSQTTDTLTFTCTQTPASALTINIVFC